jgi:hypothetical protein
MIVWQSAGGRGEWTCNWWRPGERVLPANLDEGQSPLISEEEKKWRILMWPEADDELLRGALYVCLRLMSRLGR